jgi:hypothetical protein
MAASDLQDYVGASAIDATYVEACYDQAVAMVDEFVGDAFVPDKVLLRAYLEAGSELFHRRSAPNGIAQFGALDGTPIRVARDPMIGVYPLIQRYVGLGMA